MRASCGQVLRGGFTAVATLLFACPQVLAQMVTVGTRTIDSDLANTSFGSAVASAGDVNGDGYNDVIVGAPTYTNGQSQEGQALLYLGGPNGINTNQDPDWTEESNQINGHFGQSVAGVGDVDGDGFDDVIIGAPGIEAAVGHADGWVYVYLGNEEGLEDDPVWSKNRYFPSTTGAAAGFGSSVAGAGDVDGNGYPDIIVGAPGWDDGNTDEGGAFVFLVRAAGIDAGPSWTGVSNQNGAGFGAAVAGAGDVNGDGWSDIVIGAPSYDSGETDEGLAYVYYGNSTGTFNTIEPSIREVDVANSGFGRSVAGAGNVDGDCCDDIVVGAPGYHHPEDSEGAAFSFRGGAGGLAAAPAWTMEGNQAGIGYGWSVAGAGDVDGDFKSDIVVSSTGKNSSPTVLPRVDIYLGSIEGLKLDAAWTVESNQQDSGFGNPVASARRLNSDIYSDILVGAAGYDNNQSRVFAYFLAADTDADSVANNVDNCTLLQNLDQCDSDQDGYGNRCDGDLNNNGYTNAADTTLFRAQLGLPSVPPTYNEADLNCNGSVNAQDNTLFHQLLQAPPGPSGLSCAGQTVPCPE